MKKFLKVLIVAMVLLMPLTFVSAKKAKTTTTTEEVVANGTPVKLYVFYGSTCSHCADLHTYLSELTTDKEYNYMFEVVDYEVWHSQENSELMEAVAKSRGDSGSGVPYIIIGNKSWEGFKNDYGPEMLDEIKSVYEK